MTLSMSLHNCLATQGVRTEGTIETTQAVRLPQRSSVGNRRTREVSLLIVVVDVDTRISAACIPWPRISGVVENSSHRKIIPTRSSTG